MMRIVDFERRFAQMSDVCTCTYFLAHLALFVNPIRVLTFCYGNVTDCKGDVVSGDA